LCLVAEFKDKSRAAIRGEYAPRADAERELERVVKEHQAAVAAGENRWIRIGRSGALLSDDLAAVRLEPLVLPAVGVSPRRSVWDMEW
jgi:hypothetical protein